MCYSSATAAQIPFRHCADIEILKFISIYFNLFQFISIYFSLAIRHVADDSDPTSVASPASLSLSLTLYLLSDHLLAKSFIRDYLFHTDTHPNRRRDARRRRRRRRRRRARLIGKQFRR